jgi:hypothetical protein
MVTGAVTLRPDDICSDFLCGKDGLFGIVRHSKKYLPSKFVWTDVKEMFTLAPLFRSVD